MIQGALVIVIATLLLLALAVAVLVGLAVTRRTPEEWESRIRATVRRTPGDGEDAEPVPVPEPAPHIDPVTTSFDVLARSESRPGSAYMSAEEIPGHQRVENAAQRLDRRGRDAGDQ